MIIQGSESGVSLRKLCLCCNNHDGQAGISLIGDDLVATNPDGTCGQDMLCLKDMFIPIAGSFKYNKKLAPNTKFVLKKDSQDFKFLGIYLEKNKSLLYRFVENKYSAFFNLKFTTTIGDVTNDIAEITISNSMDTDVPSVGITWENISTTLIYDSLFTQWNDIPYTWRQISPGYLSNYNVGNLVSTSTVSGNLYRVGTTSTMSNTFNVVISIGKYKLLVALYVEIDSTSHIATQTIQSVSFSSNNAAEFIIFSNDSVTTTTEGDQTIVESAHLVKLFGIIDYMTIISFLALSSSDNIDDVEFFNNSLSEVTMCMLGGY